MNKKKFELSLLQKIFFSIFPILATVLILDNFLFFVLSWDFYLRSWIFLFVLMMIQTVFLIKRIIQKTISPDKKSFYIVLSLTIILFQLYYIWYLDNRYVWKKND